MVLMSCTRQLPFICVNVAVWYLYSEKVFDQKKLKNMFTYYKKILMYGKLFRFFFFVKKKV